MTVWLYIHTKQERDTNVIEENFSMYKKKIRIQQENLYKINFPATTKKMTQPHNSIVH